MSGQGESTINLCATTSFTSRTAQSARQHGVMHTLARSAQLLFGHRSHVGASRPSMTRPQGNDVTKNSGMFRTKTQRKQRKRNNAAPRCVRVARNREAQEESKPRAHVLAFGNVWSVQFALAQDTACSSRQSVCLLYICLWPDSVRMASEAPGGRFRVLTAAKWQS